MPKQPTPTTAHGWKHQIESAGNQRCDLDVLLKDTWRHRIVIRDNARAAPTKEQELVLDGAAYLNVKNFIQARAELSLSAVALTVLHRVLAAYDHGSHTVIAYVQAGALAGTDHARLVPTLVDHTQQAGLTFSEAAEQLAQLVRQDSAYTDPSELLYRGLFDAVLISDEKNVFGTPPPIPLSLTIRDNPSAGQCRWTMSYAADLFEDQVIGGLLEIVRALLLQLTAGSSVRLDDLELVSERQHKQLDEWNLTDGAFPGEVRLDELFEAAVARTPDYPAILCGEIQLSYQELNALCNRLAHWLLGPVNRVQAGEVIALYLDKSYLAVVAPFATWKAGAAYAPIDPSHPAERVLFTLQDTRAVRLIASRRHAPALREMLAAAQSTVQLIVLEDAIEALGDANAAMDANPALALGSMQAAYVTYTSGTTGFPKGVSKTHRIVVNSITDLSSRYEMTEPGTEQVALFAAFVFEPFMRQTLIALINSQKLVVVPDDVRMDPLRFPAFVAKHRISYLNGTRSVLQHFDLRDCPSLKRMLLVGEELTASALLTLREKFHGTIINEYAFTETAFVTAVKVFPSGVSARPDRSIGRPLRNVKAYVLTQNLKRVPIGAVGELYIGGVGVAAGYLHRPDLTAERFLANPFQTGDERREGRNRLIYRTGDLARILPNGEFEFMGRSDFQLKLNGVRVEPGEIEAQTLAYPGVRQCIVVPRESGGAVSNWRLVGFYVTDPDCDVGEAELLAFLEARLVRVMVPARMVRMTRLAVNVNGKIDRQALPEVSFHGSARTHCTDAAEVAAAGENGELVDVLRNIWGQVLEIPEDSIGVNDDFFRLGGQSITCIRLLVRIWQQARVAVTVEDLYRLKTLGNLASHLALQQAQLPEAKPIQPDSPDPATDGQLVLRANGLQQGMMYQALKNVGGDAYIMQTTYRYSAALDPVRMRQAWEHAMRKFPSLRLRFEWAEEATQIVDAQEQPLDWRYIDLSAMADTQEQAARIDALQRQDRLESYTLSEGRLFRVYLIKQRAAVFSLLFSCHHIILDGWSLPILHNTVHRTYIALIRDEAVLDIAVDNSYVAAQAYWNAHRNDHLDYWSDQIRQIAEHGDFAGLLNERSRYKVDLTTYDSVLEHRSKHVRIDARDLAIINEQCASHRVTLHSVLQFVWHKVLHAVGASDTTVVGTIVSGRNLPVDGIDSSVGLFINTLPLIVNHQEQKGRTVVEAVLEIQRTVNKMNSTSTVELGSLQSGGMKRRLFDTLLVLEDYPQTLSAEEAALHDEYLRFERAYDADKVDYPIAVVAHEQHGGLTVNLWYAGELFDDAAIEALLDSVHTLFHQLAEDFCQPVGKLEYISDAVATTYDDWNRTEAAFNAHLTLSQVFEAAAGQWPAVTALVFRDTALSYQALNERANQLAHHLLATRALQADDIIALVMDKSEWMMIAILGIWKAGAAYVPIDPAYPDERIAFMLEDTSARLVLTDEAQVPRLQALGSAAPVHSVRHLPLDGEALSNPVTATASTDLAYAIYTSGTTGRPKAVLVEHRGVVNLHASLEKIFALNRNDGDEAILSFSNYVFDHFIEQMTDALLSGQTLVVLDDEMRTDKACLYQYMNDNKVTYLSGTPSVLSMYEYAAIPSLTRIDAIGEDFTTPVFDKIRATFSGMIINGYGPTEISITSHKRPYCLGQGRVNKSIGLPIANTKSYVVDAEMKLLPVGAIGELYIGGIGVARGYLNRADLTSLRFVANPFQSPAERLDRSNARLYRTGDLVRWLPNGELEYLGRNDMQVKIRGLRVELGEIEAALASFPGVARALVIAREHSVTDGAAAAQKYLIGFYLSDTDLVEQEILQAMRARLPEALVPVRVLRIAEIPVTGSGKLDLKRLPPTELLPENNDDYAAPSNDIEADLCGLWAQALGMSAPSISVNVDFFRLGGDSLRAIKLVQLITKAFDVRLSVAAVFDHTTVESQASFLIRQVTRQGKEAELSPVNMAARLQGDAPVSLAQERLLFIDEYVGGTPAYNIPFVLQLSGHNARMRDAVAAATRTLLQRHSALRTVLCGERNGVRLQHLLSEDEAWARFKMAQHTASGKRELDSLLVSESEHVFQLDTDLPVRVCLIDLEGDDNGSYLSMVFHHSAFDGWSWQILRRELETLLGGRALAQLPSDTATYADFSLWQRQRLSGARLAALSQFWETALVDSETLDLPLDHPRPPQFDYRGRELIFNIDPAIVTALKSLARSANATFYSVLLAAYSLLLKTYTGQHDILLGAPSANRWDHHFDSIVGFFANLLVLRVHVNQQMSLHEFVRATGEMVVKAQLHQELPFEQIIKTLRVENDPSRHPVVQAVFSLINDETADAAASELKSYLPDNGGWTTAKFDLSATVSETATGVSCNFTYAASLFDAASIGAMVATFEHILQEFARLAGSAAEATVADVGCLRSAEQEAQILAGRGSAPAGMASTSATLHGLFETMAQENPDRQIVVFGDKSLSYRELNQRADQVASGLLAAADLKPNDIVGLVMEKSDWMIVAMLAVWKAGAAYVPIDPAHPHERMTFMLDDTAARLVLTDEASAGLMPALASPGKRAALCIERMDFDALPRSRARTDASGADLAYAIFTSGTTGRPKAVLVRHQNVLSFRDDLVVRYFGVAHAAPQSVLFLANYVFDFSIEQLALSILSGHKLIIPTAAQLFDDHFYAYANHHALSYVSGTPTQMQQFDLSRFKHLRMVLVAGEVFHLHHFQKIRSEFTGPLLNAYGTTETTVYNTVRRFEHKDPYRNDLGEPLSNTHIYVGDSGHQLIPAGAVGELYIAGPCVAGAYLNQPALNAQRFIPNPYQTADERRDGRNAMLYKTGDMVRRRADGGLEFFGRNDSQVKINGVRIELGEVEAAIASYPGVRQCHVMLYADPQRAGASPRLCAYYVADDLVPVNEQELVGFLRMKLIPNMIPAMFIPVRGALPITINGKLDAKALAAIEVPVRQVPYAAPQSRAESQLCKIWAELLHCAAIGVDDDFFRCGGDSITALQLVSHIYRTFRRKISVKHVFDFSTVRSFAENVLDGSVAEDRSCEEPKPLTGACPMLPIQKWFFAKSLAVPGHWNQHFSIRTPVLETDCLRVALNNLVEHHDVFRLVYRAPLKGETGPDTQVYGDAAAPVALHTLDVSTLSNADLQRQLETWQSGFDLEKGPRCAAAYLHGFDDGSARVWIAMHHLIVDTVSWRILAQDLEILYHGGALPPRGSTYRQWVQAVQRYVPKHDEAQYWEELAHNIARQAKSAPLLAADAAPCHWQFMLADPDTRKLLAEGNHAFDTHLVDLLLTAVGLALPLVTQTATTYVAMEGHGREDFDGAPDVQDTVGWFTTIHPIPLEANTDIGRSILTTKANRGRVPHGGIGYGALRGTYGSEAAPIPDITFNYLGRFAAPTATPSGKQVRWQLDPDMCGSSKANADQHANKSVIDITMRCIGANMVVDVDSRLGLAVTERLALALKSSLEAVATFTAQLAAGQGTALKLQSRHSHGMAEFEPYVLANQNATGPTLFLLPPGEGGAESYLRNLARQLPQLKLVLFNNIQLHQPMQSFEEIAQYYLQYIRHLQPSGPYNFLGWSFGAVLSFEIAMQLTQAGETIANLLLIDPFLNVKKAAADVGLPAIEHVLDPINYRYAPAPDSLARLQGNTSRVVLFKADEPTEIDQTEEQRKLFGYFARSPFNNLDTLIPRASFVLEVLTGKTHFSWVNDQQLVAKLGQYVQSCVLEVEVTKPALLDDSQLVLETRP
jgi:N-(5-amino-5-carboxypentanoyl)-L-cysteinyl-D-valine synthase